MNSYTVTHSLVRTFSLFMKIYKAAIYFKLYHSYHIIFIFKHLILGLDLTMNNLLRVI